MHINLLLKDIIIITDGLGLQKKVQNINKNDVAYFIISKNTKNNVSVDSVYIKKLPMIF
jgi:hypothetical protein